MLLLGPLGYLWQQSLLPGRYSAMGMGYLDYGGGPTSGHVHEGRPVSELKLDSTRPAEVTIDLVARKQQIVLATGEKFNGYTLNGQSPGPTITATLGQIIEVRLRNDNVPDGVSLHWHGVDVPNAEDGVAGVTQDAVLPGAEFTYRFEANRVGTYWYHSHQISHTQVARGLFGALVVLPKTSLGVTDLLAVSHLYDATATINGRSGNHTVAARPGEKLRVRVVNTDNGAMPVWVTGGSFRVAAVDGYEVNQPTDVTGKSVIVTAGARADLELVVPPSGGITVVFGGSNSVTYGAAGSSGPGVGAAAQAPAEHVDLLSYGTPAALPFNPDAPNRVFTYSIGRRPGFVAGRPGLWWSVNGHLYPDMPMFVVTEGDIVRMKISNHSGAAHPIHLHGHHFVVLSRNGVKATGSPWWVDTLNVNDDESFDVAFVADNPGIWMDHCHNLAHAQQGLVVHLMYEGVTEPFVLGSSTPNEPE